MPLISDDVLFGRSNRKSQSEVAIKSPKRSSTNVSYKYQSNKDQWFENNKNNDRKASGVMNKDSSSPQKMMFKQRLIKNN